MTGPYEDIIHLPHHVSERRPQMPLIDRAAQFSPFAALTGYEEAVKETARLTDTRIELDDDAKEQLDAKLRLLADRVPDQPKASISYFQPDRTKNGGAYVTAVGVIRRVDRQSGFLLLDNGEKIFMEDILDIQSRWLPEHV